MRTLLDPGALSRLHDSMTAHVDAGHVTGTVTFVSCGDAAHIDTTGRQSLDGAPMAYDTIFRISSMTKPITAAAALTLVDEGALRLDDAVDHWLPELAAPRVLAPGATTLDHTEPAQRAITVRDLLTFRLGHGIVFDPTGTAPSGASAIGAAYDDLRLGQGPPAPAVPPPTDEWLRRLGSLPLQHQPGAAWRYHTGADVLGALVERVTGQRLDRALHERVFAPLDMVDTGFVVPPAKAARFATQYACGATGALEVIDDPAHGQWSSEPAFFSGGAGLVSTAVDLARFARALAHGGTVDGVRLLRPETVRAMTSDQLHEAERTDPYTTLFLDGRGWGLGLAVTVDVHAGPDGPFGSAGTYGWDGGLGTVWRTDRRTGCTVLVLTQTAWSSPAGAAVCADAWRLAAAATAR